MSGLGKADSKGVQMSVGPSELLSSNSVSETSLRASNAGPVVHSHHGCGAQPQPAPALPAPCPFTHLLYCHENLKQKYRQAPSSTVPLAPSMTPESILVVHRFSETVPTTTCFPDLS